MIRIFGLFVLSVSTLAALPSLAQEARLPGFTLTDVGPMMQEQKIVVAPTPEEAFKDIENEQMRNVLMLQSQITMINALTNWQSQVSRLEEAYTTAGLSFTPPAPPKDICAQVPSNALCDGAYGAQTGPTVRSADSAAPSNNTPSQAAAPRPAKPAAPPEPPPASYEWADIRCMANACRATIVDLMTGARQSVIEGESLAEKVMVQSISPDGVMMRINGEVKSLRASDAPAHLATPGKAADTPTGPASQSDLQNVLTAVPSTPEGMAADSAPIVLDDGTGGMDNAAAEAQANTANVATGAAAPPMDTTVTTSGTSADGGVETGLF